jgi:SAM-dependent methyltransferase
MNDYDASTYGDGVADVYDNWYPGGDPEPIVHRLSGLAEDGPALELGIGTGRIAIPLAAAGVTVHGIDASKAMVARLRSKAAASGIPVTIGDFTSFELEHRFSLVYVVFNTFFSLLEQEDQVCCFQTVANHLRPEGRFVLECFVPDLGRFDRGQRFAVHAIDDEGIRVEATLHDPVRQGVRSKIVSLAADGARFYPLQARYCWPSELDLMARLAGLELEQRWGGWSEEPFTAASVNHVSVYRKPG